MTRHYEYLEKHLSGLDISAIKHVLTKQNKRDIMSYEHFVKNTKMLDNSRKHHIKDFIPELWELIKEDYNAIQI